MARISIKDKKEAETSTAVEQEKKKTSPAPRKKKVEKKVFEPSDRILCHSVTQGGLFVDGPRTKVPYSFVDYGAEEEIEYRDLVALIHAKSDFIFNPYLVIDDKDFIAEFPQLDKLYSSSYELSDLASILDLPVDDMIAKINKLPPGAAENLKVLASSQVVEGRLDSVKKIKALNEFYGIDLNFIAELQDN